MRIHFSQHVAVLGIALFAAQAAVAAQPPPQREGCGGFDARVSPFNPPGFQQYVSSPSPMVRFLATPRGKEVLATMQSGSDAAAQAFASGSSSSRRRGRAESFHPSQSSAAPSTEASCTGPVGPRYNLEAPEYADPQNQESIDMLFLAGIANADLVVTTANDYRGLNDSLSAYYVNRTGGCGADFEGGLPPITPPCVTATEGPTGASGCPATLYGAGEAAVTADQRRLTVFVADRHESCSDSAIVLFKSSQNLLNNICAGGTHNPAQASTCWPSSKILDMSCSNTFDQPSVIVDQRSTGVGSSDVYTTYTQFDGCYSSVKMVVCPNDFATSCTEPIYISGKGEPNAMLSHVSVRPDGKVTVTYVNVGFDDNDAPFSDIKYVSCTPLGVQNGPPNCDEPILVRHEVRPLTSFGKLAAQDFGGNDFEDFAATATAGASASYGGCSDVPVVTFPKHDHRLEGGVTETYIVYDRCFVDLWMGYMCPRAEVVMMGSNNNGGSWSQPTRVNARAADQIMPWIKTDRATNTLNIVYYTSELDPFNHRHVVRLARIIPGAALPDVPSEAQMTYLTTLQNEPQSDPTFGGFNLGTKIGVAVRGTGTGGGSRSYTAHTYNVNKGIYNSQSSSQQDNHVNSLTY